MYLNTCCQICIYVSLLNRYKMSPVTESESETKQMVYVK